MQYCLSLFPETIYLRGDEHNPTKVRCYLHYSNQLPIIDFMVTIRVHFTAQINRHLNIYANSVTNAISSALDFDDDHEKYLV